MSYIIEGYRHTSFFHYFEDISRIPRGSGNEGGIAAFLKAFADERGIYCVVDEYHNVFMRKGATAGYEDVAPILLQGHTDMVCEKNADSDHDFTKDPLDLYIDNKGFLRARGTTLGGDDGVAVIRLQQHFRILRFVEEFRAQLDGTNQGWRGEFWGKMLRGGALVYA